MSTRAISSSSVDSRFVLGPETIPVHLSSEDLENNPKSFSFDRDSSLDKATGVMTLGYGQGTMRFYFEYKRKLDSIPNAKPLVLADARACTESQACMPDRNSFNTMYATKSAPKTVEALEAALKQKLGLHKA